MLETWEQCLPSCGVHGGAQAIKWVTLYFAGVTGLDVPLFCMQRLFLLEHRAWLLEEKTSRASDEVNFSS
ncbi:hypothetical protein Y1Q_0009315 [Alligator mississippiensis]|uniref:Uncharacterized protein n=1 Tax=Alligator mississippiensis TaxID=8496 RepID=A0A151N7G6_ALLMI|nr:hypothetical protein Y1Q_0009315 [Alligator mississippiensis]